MMKHIYILALFLGLTNPFLKGQTNKEVIAIKANYYFDYQYTDENQGVATGPFTTIIGKVTSIPSNGKWIGLPEGKTYPDNSLILTEVTTADELTIPMEEEGKHRFKAMPASIRKPPIGDRSAYLKAFINGYGKDFEPGYQDKYAWYVTSGRRGLDLSTGVTNIPNKPIISYGAVIISLERVKDNAPDLIITQIAAPGRGATDKFEFLDKYGNKIPGAKHVQVNFSGIRALGSREWNFYNSDNHHWGSGPRELRMVTFDLKDFGINENNYKKVAQLIYYPSGDSDTAFLAVDEYSMIVYRNDCEGISDMGNPGMAKVGISTLQRGNEDWLSEESGAYLELESSKKGFVITSNDNPKDNITHPEEGMLVWDTTDKCLKIYNDILGKLQWHCINKCIKPTPNP